MELSEYDDLIKRLVTIAIKQDAINDDLRAVILRQDTTNRRLEETMTDIKSFVQQQGVVNTQNTTLVMRISRTLDLIEEKLGQLLPPRAEG